MNLTPHDLFEVSEEIAPIVKKAGSYIASKFNSNIEVLKKGLKVMDSTSVSLCMDNKLPMVIFNFRHKHSIKRVLLGEKIGTTVGV